MNREIKFRAFNMGKMYSSVELCLIESNGMDGMVAGKLIGIGSSHLNVERFGGEVLLMQFTGLKDKNGVDIYEGDILNLGSNGFTGETDYMAVTWNPEQCQFNVSVESLGDGRFVCGNIYENTELLH